MKQVIKDMFIKYLLQTFERLFLLQNKSIADKNEKKNLREEQLFFFTRASASVIVLIKV